MVFHKNNFTLVEIIIKTLDFIFKVLLPGPIVYSFQWQDKAHPHLSWSSSAHFTEKYSLLEHGLHNLSKLFTLGWQKFEAAFFF